MTEDACQRALGIQEILRRVCSEANVGCYIPQTTLVSLATTSKIFTDPAAALDVIWREQRSLAPLVKCMPETLWEEHDTKRIPGLVIILMPRFLFYSVRVRELELQYHSYGILHDDLADNTTMLSILPFIKSSCPLVSEFTLGGSPSPLSHGAVSDAVCGWQYLTDLPNLDRAGFLHVAQLASLTSLSLCSQEETALHPPDFLSGPTFPSLEYLYVRCQTARFYTGLIQVISSRRLKDLTLHPLADCLDHTALKFIEVEEGGNLSTRPPDIAPWVLTADALRPLLAFDKLSSIVYQLYSGVDFDDYFLDEMTQAWSGTRTLQFDTEVLIVPPPRATLGCLLSFARNCPVLEMLGIRMDATHVPEFTQEPGDRLEGSVGYLHIGTSRINSQGGPRRGVHLQCFSRAGGRVRVRVGDAAFAGAARGVRGELASCGGPRSGVCFRADPGGGILVRRGR
ncbi:hypothetical protein DFH08DRAFT_828752 [Mycena albidolilacea]|uniref:Uncharacterized protein n=1 Tax=Mycena albidolilacea TaxID=1033008 RepID=A0AAD7AT65_9AGAR|nr:hypothetical protein DFH08DRAFT_828752 [Mycena albidolilacea]